MIKSSLKSKNGPSVYEPSNLILSCEILPKKVVSEPKPS